MRAVRIGGVPQSRQRLLCGGSEGGIFFTYLVVKVFKHLWHYAPQPLAGSRPELPVGWLNLMAGIVQVAVTCQRRNGLARFC